MSRALRKAQQRAEEERLAALAAAPPDRNDGEEEEEEDEEEEKPVSKKQANLFDMLNAELEEAEDDDRQDDEDEEEAEESKPQQASLSKKKKNKKKKKKGKGKPNEASAAKDDAEAQDDEDIDAIIQSLKVSSHKSATAQTEIYTQSSPSSRLQSLLHIDPRHLDLENEMRKLFGRTATSRESGSANNEPRQQQQRGQGRASGGRPLVASGGRRNVFVQPAENWPREGSGGLSMDLVSKQDDGTVEFKYVHSRAYQDVQRQFNECVRSMDPERMITHMHSHPYHISTLLQVSHIAAAQSNDHNTSQQLISRALYSLGRSSHSVFPTSLASGTARLSFSQFENRELFFAGWKYVQTLSRRGLWRTGLEFIRMLLGFEPLTDPLCLSLLIDQYALKSRAPEVLLELYDTPLLNATWKDTPNVLYSLSLAHLMAGDKSAAVTALKQALERYPWMMTKLHGSLSEAGNLPGQLWGLLPPSETDSLLCELYTLRMGDLWNIPENAAFLTSAITRLTDSSSSKQKLNINPSGSVSTTYVGEKMKNLARHVFLMDASSARSLIGFLPAEYRNNQGYAWDILPPAGGESSYQKEMESQTYQGAGAGAGGPGIPGSSRGLFEVFLQSLLPSFTPPAAPPASANTAATQPPADTRGGPIQTAAAAADGEGNFEVGEEQLQAAITSMVADGVGFPPGSTTISDRAVAVLNLGVVPPELIPWFGERFGMLLEPQGGGATPMPDREQPGTGTRRRPTVEDDDDDDEEEGEDEGGEGEVQRDSQAIDRLVQILGSGDRASLRIRVDRMFEGQGGEMADVKRRVEERLGLR